jgi:hypothetical protein
MTSRMCLTCREMCFVVQPLSFCHAHIVVALLAYGSNRGQKGHSEQRALYIAGFCEQLAFFRMSGVASVVQEFTFIGSLGHYYEQGCFHSSSPVYWSSHSHLQTNIPHKYMHQCNEENTYSFIPHSFQMHLVHWEYHLTTPPKALGSQDKLLP